MSQPQPDELAADAFRYFTTTADGCNHVEVNATTGEHLEAPTVPLEALMAPTADELRAAAPPTVAEQITAGVRAGLEAAGVKPPDGLEVAVGEAVDAAGPGRVESPL